MAKMGRPKTDNPKDHRLCIRFTEEEYRKLSERAAEESLSMAEAVRKGVELFVEKKA